MMEYKLTIFLMLLGVAYHVMSCISKLRKKFPELGVKTVWNTFINQEWDSLIVSALGIIVFETLLYSTHHSEFKMPNWLHDYGIYVLALVWGYAGQRLSYKFLQTGEAVLEKKAEQLNNN